MTDRSERGRPLNVQPGDSAFVPMDYMRRPGAEVIVEEVYEDGVAVGFFVGPTGFEWWEYDELDWPYHESEAGP